MKAEIKKLTGIGRTAAFFMTFVFVAMFQMLNIGVTYGVTIPVEIGGPILAAFLITWLILLVDIGISDMPIRSKILWCAICIFTNAIGITLYFYSNRWKGEQRSIITTIVHTIVTFLIITLIVSLICNLLLFFGVISPPIELYK